MGRVFCFGKEAFEPEAPLQRNPQWMNLPLSGPQLELEAGASEVRLPPCSAWQRGHAATAGAIGPAPGASCQHDFHGDFTVTSIEAEQPPSHCFLFGFASEALTLSACPRLLSYSDRVGLRVRVTRAYICALAGTNFEGLSV